MGMRGSRPLPAIFSHKLSMPCGQLFLFLHYRRINVPITNVLMYLSRQSWRPLRILCARCVKQVNVPMTNVLMHFSVYSLGPCCVTLCARCVKPGQCAND